jgi:phage tail-like protein
VTTENGSVSARIFQVEAETTSPSYLDYLPEVYRRKDAPARFLECWLKLVQGEIDDWEWELEAMPRRFDPLTTPEGHLSWLAKWLAFPLPSGRDADALRSIFAKIPELYTRRGTPSGIRDLAKLYTGEPPHLFEAFHTRRIWQLGVTSTLGLETTLPAALPDGMVVPGWSMADPDLMGLRGDYYKGVNFETLMATRDDAQVDFNLVMAPAPFDASENISVRWSGQLQPRSTDLYTISAESTGGVRLWVDGRLIVDNWNQPRQQDIGRIALTEGRWYPIVVEYFSEKGGSAHLFWSSRNQRKEIIPQERLYRLRDEFARLEGPAATADSCPVLVGQTVVGESEPLAADEYGAPLYNESAHLFTVSIAAARLRTPTQREMLRAVIEREKPAHTDYHLCFVEARMRVGFQARIGVDSIIAGPPEPLSLEGTILGIESYLGDDETQGRVGRVGTHGHIGYDTVLG